MANLNQCNFIGNVGQVETRYLASGDAVTNLSLAVNEKWKDKAGVMQEHTEWVRATFFGKLAEVVEKYVKKGDPLFISGRMKTEKWTDKDGQDRYTTKIIADKMQLLGGKRDDKSDDDSAPAASHTPPSSPTPSTGGGSFDDFDDSGIPF